MHLVAVCLSLFLTIALERSKACLLDGFLNMSLILTYILCMY